MLKFKIINKIKNNRKNKIDFSIQYFIELKLNQSILLYKKQNA